MTPAIQIANNAKISYRLHEYSHEPSEQSYGLEAANKLGISKQRIFKTLLVNTGAKELAVAIVPVSSMLSMKLMAKALDTKKASMALPSDVERTTGYLLGALSPLGQKKKLKTLIDCSALEYPTIFVSAGRRGLEIELEPGDLLALTQAEFAQLCQ